MICHPGGGPPGVPGGPKSKVGGHGGSVEQLDLLCLRNLQHSTVVTVLVLPTELLHQLVDMWWWI